MTLGNIEIECTVLFADIAGSTSLYERLGDKQAQKVIGETLTLLSRVSVEFNGIVIKTIGDEVMCRFDEADHAVYAACLMNEALADKLVDSNVKIDIRIGIHSGSAIVGDDDLFGDAVNTASRMTDAAGPGKIIITAATANQVSAELSNTRLRAFDRALVKGKIDKIDMFEVLWNLEDITRVATGPIPDLVVPLQHLELTVQNRKLEVESNVSNFTIGRGKQCNLYVDANLASRIHARIEYHRGKFVLIDQSTNGSFIRTHDGKQVYLKREETPLSGRGIISLGRPVAEEDNLIFYLCT